MLSDWEQTPAFKSLIFKRYLYCSIDFDLMTFIFDLDLDQMTLAKYKKDQTIQIEKMLNIYWYWKFLLF